MKDKPAVRIVIGLDAYARLRAYVDAAPGEITLLGAARFDRAAATAWVEKFYLPDQVCSAAHTAVDADALADVLTRAVRDGVDTTTLRVWCHSHAAMSANFFSGTDDRAVETAFPQAAWVISIVTNKAGELRGRVTLYEPVSLDLDNVPVSVGLAPEIEAAVQAEVRERVRSAGPTLAIVGRGAA
jgi:hypothetical protein